MERKIKIVKKVDAEKRHDAERRAEIATFRGVCALLALKYPNVLIDEYKKLREKTEYKTV